MKITLDGKHCLSHYVYMNNNSTHQGRYTKNSDGRVYTLIVIVHADGSEQVAHGFKGKHYASLKNAERAVARFIAQA